MAQRFTFDNAFLHFARTDGPRGFVWKYLLCYAVGAICLAAIGYLLFRPLLNIWFSVFLEAMGGASEAEIEAIFARRVTEIVGWVVFGNLAMLVLGVLFWAVFEAAVQRRYVRDEGFRIRLGGDEFRLLLVGLIWGVCFIASYILSLMVIGISTAFAISSLDDQRLGMLVLAGASVLVFLFWVWVAIRLAPASAMTVRDGRVKFFDAWGATRGRFWSLLGAYIVLGIIIYFAAVIAWFVFGSAIVASFWANFDAFQEAQDSPIELFALITSFDIITPLIAAYVGWLMLQGLFGYMWAGPAALAAKTDPRGGGVTQAPEAFA